MTVLREFVLFFLKQTPYLCVEFSGATEYLAGDPKQHLTGDSWRTCGFLRVFYTRNWAEFAPWPSYIWGPFSGDQDILFSGKA